MTVWRPGYGRENSSVGGLVRSPVPFRMGSRKHSRILLSDSSGSTGAGVGRRLELGLELGARQVQLRGVVAEAELAAVGVPALRQRAEHRPRRTQDLAFIKHSFQKGRMYSSLIIAVGYPDYAAGIAPGALLLLKNARRVPYSCKRAPGTV